MAKRRNVLTPRQRDIILCIQAFIETHRFSPTIPEIGKELDITEKAAHKHIQRLARKGYLKEQPSRPHAIQVIKPIPHLYRAATDIDAKGIQKGDYVHIHAGKVVGIRREI